MLDDVRGIGQVGGVGTQRDRRAGAHHPGRSVRPVVLDVDVHAEVAGPGSVEGFGEVPVPADAATPALGRGGGSPSGPALRRCDLGVDYVTVNSATMPCRKWASASSSAWPVSRASG